MPKEGAMMEQVVDQNRDIQQKMSRWFISFFFFFSDFSFVVLGGKQLSND